MSHVSGSTGASAWQVITESNDSDPAMTAYLRLLAEQADAALNTHQSLEHQEEQLALDAEQVCSGPMKRLIERLRRRSHGKGPGS